MSQCHACKEDTDSECEKCHDPVCNDCGVVSSFTDDERDETYETMHCEECFND